MTPLDLLTECGIDAHRNADGGVSFVCKCGGAAELVDASEGGLFLYCGRCAPGPGRAYTVQEFRKAFGNGHVEAEDRGSRTIRFERSDAGNAELLADLFGGNLRFVHGPKAWRVYHGGRWAEDRNGAAERFALDAAKQRYEDAFSIPDETQAAAEAKWAVGSRSARRVRDCLAIAANTFPFTSTPREYDEDAWSLNVGNGVVDLRTGEISEHDPGAMHSKLAPVEYIPGAEAPRWESLLREVFDGNEDLVAYVRRCVGYTLVGGTSEQVMFLMVGRGANGKTTFLNILSKLLGDYYHSFSFSTFSFAKEKTAGVRDDLAYLPGVRMASASEPSVGLRLSEGLLKQIAGGDPLRVRHLYGREFTFTPAFTLWLSANRKPTVRDTSEGFWRKLRVIPFTVSFLGREDIDLADRLAGELPGILNWAVLGALEWQRDGLNPPNVVTTATADYRASEDPVGTFLGDCAKPEPEAFTLTKDLRDAYLTWCEDNKETALPGNSFGEALAEKGFTSARASGGPRGWQGIRLVTE